MWRVAKGRVSQLIQRAHRGTTTNKVASVALIVFARLIHRVYYTFFCLAVDESFCWCRSRENADLPLTACPRLPFAE
jgi:hypothetical protein